MKSSVNIYNFPGLYNHRIFDHIVCVCVWMCLCNSGGNVEKKGKGTEKISNDSISFHDITFDVVVTATNIVVVFVVVVISFDRH